MPTCRHAGCIDRRSCKNRTRFRTRHTRPYGGCVRRGCFRHGSTGGYTIRPYGSACGFLVGAGPDSRRGTMVLLAVGARIARPLATRMQSTSPIAAGVGRHAHMPPCRVHRPKVLQKPHSVPDAPCAPLRRVCSARVLPTRRCGPGGYTIRPYGPACGFLVGADAHIGPLVLCAKCAPGCGRFRHG